MTRIFQEFFHVHGRIAEGAACLGFGHGDGVDQRGFGMHRAHASAATAARRLDDDRVTDFVGHTQIFLVIVRQGIVIAGNAGDAGGQHGVFGGNLVAHQAYGFGIRADKHKAALFYFFRKIRVFGQKSVAGMDGFRIGHFGGADNGRNIQVAVSRGRRAYAYRLIGQSYMFKVAIRLGMDGDDFNA